MTDVSLLVSSVARPLADRVTVSSGIVSAHAAGRVADYDDAAWVPREPFRTLTAAEWPTTPGAGPLARTRTVGLVPITALLLERLRADASRARSRGDLAPHVCALCECLAADWEVESPPASLSLGRHSPGLPTVTRDPDSGQFVGLHVDTFHENYGESRAIAGNRVSVNIGTEPRYFLFVPLSFREVHRRAERPAGSAASVVTRFLAANPGQQVLRLRVDPGEAYIAPTESIVHDASSRPGTAAGLHVTGRGVFNPRPC